MPITRASQLVGRSVIKCAVHAGACPHKVKYLHRFQFAGFFYAGFHAEYTSSSY